MENIEHEETRDHTAQARWFAERLERMNEALANLSGVFIGFLGIELAFLGQIPKKDINLNWIASISARASVIFLIIAIFCFVKALQSDDFEMPDRVFLRDSWETPKGTKIKEPLRIMLDLEDNFNIIKSLEIENTALDKWYTRGIYFGLLGQIALAILLFAKWV